MQKRDLWSLAAALAVFGIQSVIAYSVVQRSRETGIRMAMGAPAERVVRDVVRRWMAPVLFGLGVGLSLTWALVIAMASRVQDFPGLETGGSLGVAVGFVLVALVACWLPARRAARVDPAEVIRAD